MVVVDIGQKIKEYNVGQQRQWLNNVNQSRKRFVDDYPLDLLNSWQWIDRDKYVIGKANSFCYRLEHELIHCGNISSSTAYKYGIYFSKKDQCYKYSSKYGNDEKEAFKNVIQEIVNLLQAAENNNDTAFIKKSKLCDLVKGKLLFVYHADKYLPIYGREHLLYFIRNLGIKSTAQTVYDLQQDLIQWKNGNNITASWTMLEFEKFLYFAFGKPKKTDAKVERELDEELNEEVGGELSQESAGSIIVSDYEAKKSPPQPIVVQGHNTYPRDPKISRNALIKANHLCEYDSTHPTFIRKRSNDNYTEPHHLIPMCFQDKFPQNSLDTEANIVSLCSNCHNRIHYGKDAPVLLKKLLADRKKYLEKLDIKIDEKQLLKLYKLLD